MEKSCYLLATVKMHSFKLFLKLFYRKPNYIIIFALYPTGKKPFIILDGISSSLVQRVRFLNVSFYVLFRKISHKNF